MWVFKSAHTQMFRQVRLCWSSELGMLSTTDQQQHLYKLNASILDSVCCSLTASPEHERPFRSRLAASTAHSPEPPLSPMWSLLAQ